MAYSASMIVAVAVGLLFALIAVSTSLVEFDEGKASMREVEGTWLSSWKALIAATAAAAIAAGFIELVVFEADCVHTLQWEVALAATVLCAWADVREGIIPNRVVLLVVVAALAIAVAQILALAAPWNVVALSSVGGGVLGGGVFLLSRLLTRGGVGYGDVKLFASLGLLLGFQMLFNAMFYGLIAAFVYAIGLVVIRKKKINDRLPLGPFALIGVLASIGFGV